MANASNINMFTDSMSAANMMVVLDLRARWKDGRCNDQRRAERALLPSRDLSVQKPNN
jgi:hypothetical protein